MPFSGNTYTGPSGSTNAAAGQVVQSAVWNAINTDYADALTTLMTLVNTGLPGWQNIMISNGGFNVWQRGTTVSVSASSTAYTADRWYLTTGANEASTVTADTDLETHVIPNSSAKVTKTAGETGTAAMVFGYPLDSDEVYRMRGNRISFTCMARGGANWSPTSGVLTAVIAVGTGAPAKRGAGFTGETVMLTINTNLVPGASSATTISGTSTSAVPTNAAQGEIQFTWTPVGTAGADDSVTIDDCCVVLGTIAQGYEEIPFQVNKSLCERFYRKSFQYSTAPAQAAGTAGAASAISQGAAQSAIYIRFEPSLRSASPTVTFFNPSATTSTWVDLTTSVSVTASATFLGTSGMMIYTVANVSAANHQVLVHYTADASI